MTGKFLQAFFVVSLGLLPLQLQAQARPQATPPARRPPFGLAPDTAAPWSQELAGAWTSMITNNWRMRMVTPPKGDYVGMPITSAAVKVADTWDPAKDTANGQQCRAYGAAEIMMRPEHLHINWGTDQKTLVIDIDAGTQQRVLHLSDEQPAGIAASWQGYSTAHWRSRGTPGYVHPAADQYPSVVTTRMLPGYLRQNGVPYSGNAVLTEDFDVARVAEQETYLVITSSVADPIYLETPLVLTAIFKKERGDTGWEPTPCSSTW